MNDQDRFDVISLLEPLRRYARSLTRDESRAEDLVQDVLVRAYERRSTFKTSGNLRTWLLSILHNRFIDEHRRRVAEARRARNLAEIADSAVPPPQDDHVRLGQIREAFLRLPEEQRAALHLVAVEGLSYQEAADLLGVPIGTLMSRLGRARAALRQFENGPALPAPQRPHLKIVGGSDG